jgi:hypothetical protein
MLFHQLAVKMLFILLLMAFCYRTPKYFFT